MSEAARPPDLTEREIRFVSEYIAEPNATRAYMRAFKCKSYCTAKTEGNKLLRKPEVEAELAVARESHARACGVSFKRTLRKLASIAFQDADDFYEPDPEAGGLPKPKAWSEIAPAARKNIASIKFKRRKLRADDKTKTVTKTGDATTTREVVESYELEEIEYKTLDAMGALALLCRYLGITKGSLTADDLRSILFADAAKSVAGATPAAEAAVPARPVPPSGGGGTAEQPLHPDE